MQKKNVVSVPRFVPLLLTISMVWRGTP